MFVECTELNGVGALRLARLNLTGRLDSLNLGALASSLTTIDLSGMLQPSKPALQPEHSVQTQVVGRKPLRHAVALCHAAWGRTLSFGLSPLCLQATS